MLISDIIVQLIVLCVLLVLLVVSGIVMLNRRHSRAVESWYQDAYNPEDALRGSLQQPEVPRGKLQSEELSEPLQSVQK